MPPAALTIKLTAPVAAPLHNTLTGVATGDAVIAGGWVMVLLPLLIHPFASVTVTIYVPAARPVAVCVVCIGALFQLYE